MTDHSTSAGTPELSSAQRPAADPNSTNAVQHLPEQGRFRLLIDDREVAVLDYRRLPGTWNIVNTFTDAASRGHGVASDLVRAALDAARDEGVTVIPTCRYVSWWIAGHHGYEDIVAAA